MQNLLYGLYRGIITNNDDPLNQMRIRARIPDVFGKMESPWALPCVPPGASDVPEVGIHVWIGFEAGDLNRPVWLGTLGVSKKQNY